MGKEDKEETVKDIIAKLRKIANEPVKEGDHPPVLEHWQISDLAYDLEFANNKLLQERDMYKKALRDVFKHSWHFPVGKESKLWNQISEICDITKKSGALTNPDIVDELDDSLN